MKRIGLLTTLMLSLLVGCLGGGSKKTSDPDCAAGQAFDTVSRSCQGAIVTQQPPTTTLTSLSLLEDSGTTTVTLSYTDANSDQAFSCSVTSLSADLYTVLPACSCSGGVCTLDLTPDLDFNGLGDFFYTLTDNDGTSSPQYVTVNVSSVNDAPDVTNVTMTVDEDTTYSNVDLTVVAAPVTVAGSFDDNQSGAPSPNENNTPLEFTIITGASKGTASINSSSGLFTYVPDANDELSGGDSVVIGVRDSIMTGNGESYIPVSITVNAGVLNPDNPSATTTSYAGTFTEDTAYTFNAANGQLGGTEFDSADFGNTFECVIEPGTSDVFQTGTCSCAETLGSMLCDVAVLPKQNVDSTSTPQIEYFVHDVTNTLDSSSQTFNITMTSVDDDPVAHSTVDGSSGTVDFNEPAGPAPAAATSFTIDQGWDESQSTLSYAIITGPSAGTLSSCSTTAGVFSCDYTATSGNLENTATPTFAQYLQNDLQIDSLVGGPDGNNIDITIIGAPNIGSSPQIIVDPANNEDLTIYVDDGTGPNPVSTTPANVGTAILAHPIAKNLVTVTALGATAVTAQASTAMAGGNVTDPYADKFTYQITDTNSNTSLVETVYIDITGTNDKPVMCNYSTYTDLNECGGLGCIGSNNPSDLSITPSTHTASKPIVFFNKAEGVCWISTSTTAWDIVDNATDPSHIQDILVNEGEGTIVLDNFGVDEGGSGTEDVDTLGVTSVISDNTVLVPNGNVAVYFNDVAQTVGVMPGSAFGAGTSEGDGDFRLEITPQVGNVGEANITITLEDLSGGTSSFTFKVTVQAFSAIHNGWKNITAVGPKFDKFDLLKDSNKNVCSYNLDKCDSGKECTKATVGQADPNGVVTADSDDVLYYDADTDKCYHAATAGTTWTEVSTYCAVTPTNLNSNCLTLDAGTDVASCISTAAPTINATELNQHFWDATNSVCYRSIATGTGASDWETYNASATVTIEWEAFDPVPNTESITSYEVYRRLANEAFDYTQRLNREVIDDAVTTYVDNAVNSTSPPIPGTVYYYEVRPVIQSVSTSTDEVFKTLRVTAPPDNMVFVHRWMVNKSMCELMNSTSIDPNNNYRCDYEGPGDSKFTPGSNYYDIGSDLLVDRNEAGCNYGSAPACIGTSDGACVGIDDPTTAGITTTGALDGVIYYARSNGKCYESGGGGTTWSEVTGATAIAGYIKAHIPPLVNISQSNAHDFCSAESTQTILGISMGDSATGANCKFTKDVCSAGDCTGAADPNGAVTGPIGSLYLDTAGGNCLYNVNGGTEWSITGCHVSKGSCAPAGDCVAAGDPNTVQTAKTGSTYYDTGGTCYTNTSAGGSGTTWTAVAATSMSLAKVLPSRKQQMAYGLWDTENNTDPAITTLETGLSLNSSAKCNSSSANGLASNYSDVNVPDSNTFYSLPGTATSNIRSMITGSDETNSCISRFGVQDHVGNVAEWTSERFNCRSTCPYSLSGCDTSDSQCIAAASPDGSVVAEIGTYFSDTSGGGTCWINYDGDDDWKPAHCAYSDDTCDTGDTVCLFAGDPNGAVSSSSSAILLWDTSTDTCWKNTGGNSWVDEDAALRNSLDFGAQLCTSRINGETDALAATSNDMRYGTGVDQWFDKYLLDGAVGPCVDSDSDDACDGNIDSWELEDERNSAGRYIIPMGLPVVTDFNTNFPASSILDFLFEIGPTSGITSTQLRDDVVTFDSATIAGETNGCGGMAAGGSYQDGSGAGVYNLELLPCTDTAKSRITVGDITIVQRGSITPNLEFFNPGGALADEVVDVNPATGQIIVTLRHDGSNIVSTPASIMEALTGDNDADCEDGGTEDINCLGKAFISGDASALQSSSSQTNFSDTDKSDAMVDVGFRCVVPVSGYEE